MIGTFEEVVRVDNDGRYGLRKRAPSCAGWSYASEAQQAATANVPQPRVSDYVSGKPDSNLIARRNEEAVRDIVHVFEALAPIRIVLDPDSFPKAVEIGNIMQRSECAEVAG